MEARTGHYTERANPRRPVRARTVERDLRFLHAACAWAARWRLRYSDLRLDRASQGSIRWPADTDKEGRESVVPLSPRARQAVDRVLAERPAPRDPLRPVDRHVASSWLREAERLANLEPQEGSLWHSGARRGRRAKLPRGLAGGGPGR